MAILIHPSHFAHGRLFTRLAWFQRAGDALPEVRQCELEHRYSVKQQIQALTSGLANRKTGADTASSRRCFADDARLGLLCSKIRSIALS
ncbi:hypothetical protein COMA2_320004 [Candidatus Nitrospira nitrificans]|uniref:Uncharacterized protein n=1 Tax=Candidatus Nitrospira nitrificans TaxID=1742973 RepID=A0A0S4LJF3_9BACT|nr:hypothetical protein COMA2_320004 [Candidatus Nitrospira nitrificans]